MKFKIKDYPNEILHKLLKFNKIKNNNQMKM